MDIRYDYDFYESLLIVDSRLTKEKFLKRAGIISGYAEILFSKIYDALFSESEDLIQSFNKYYVDEFDDFYSYLKREFAIDDESFQQMYELLNVNPNLKVIRWSQLSFGENSMPDMIFGEEMGDKFKEILLGIGYED